MWVQRPQLHQIPDKDKLQFAKRKTEGDESAQAAICVTMLLLHLCVCKKRFILMITTMMLKLMSDMVPS